MQRRKRQRPGTDPPVCTDEDPPGFLVKNSPGKGRGVFTDKSFQKGEFLVTYPGELITGREGEMREDSISSVFRYFFKYQDKNWCVDATNEPVCGPKLGRLVNHGRGNQANAKMVVKVVNNLPVLCLFSKRRLSRGEEILYDYGLEEKDMPWMNKPPSSSPPNKGNLEEIDHQPLRVTRGDTPAVLGHEPEVDDHHHPGDEEGDSPTVLEREMEEADPKEMIDTGGDAPAVLVQELLIENQDHPRDMREEVPALPEGEMEAADYQQLSDTGGDFPAVLGHDADIEDQNNPGDMIAKALAVLDAEMKLAEHKTFSDTEGDAPAVIGHETQLEDRYKRPAYTSGEASALLDEVFELEKKDANHHQVTHMEGVTSAGLEQEVAKHGKNGDSETMVTTELNQELQGAEHTKIKDVKLIREYFMEDDECEGQSDQDSETSSDDESEYLPSDEADVVPPSDESHDSFPNYTNLNLLHATDMGTSDSQDITTSNKENSPGPSVVHVNTTSNSDGRKYDKKHVCFYCEVPQSKLPRHLKSAHLDESAVKDWIDETDSKLKNAKLAKIRNLGNHINNSKVLEEGNGELLVKYRPVASVDPSEFVPCPTCYAYITKKFLWKHTCPLQSKQDCAGQKKRGDRVRNGSLLLPSPSGADAEVAELLTTLKNDNVSRVIKSDHLIIQLAKKENLKLGHDSEHQNYIRTKLREVARLLIEARVVCNDANITLTDLIHPAKYDVLVSATRNVTGFDRSTHACKVPSLALKLGHSLKKCALIVKAEGLKSGDEVAVNQSTKFHELCEMKWTEDISVHAHRTLTENNRNKPKRLPLAEDILRLTSYLKETSEEQKKVLKEEASDSITAWKSLNELTLTQVMLFNRRRQGEMSRMSVDDFNNRCLPESTDYISDSLSNFEKELCRTFKRVEIIGKKGRTVPVLLTKEMEESMTLLLNTREKVGVSVDNTYMFPANSGSHIRGSDCIRKYAVQCGARNPGLLRSTALRKQIATVSQVLNLQDNELDILAKFLGHDVRVHREFYRLPDSTLQVAKISKLLLSLESGTTSNLAGKSLNEIDVEMDEQIQEDNSDTDEDDAEEGDEEGEQECLNPTSPEAKSDRTPRAAPQKEGNAREDPGQIAK